MIEQPEDNAPATFRAGELIGKFHGENAATGPIGWRSTVWRMPSSLGMTRPYSRNPSVASHSMMSQPRKISSRACSIGLPCSSVIAIAISLTRSRMRLAAFRMICVRLAGEVLRQIANPRSAAAIASSRSAMVAVGTVPSTLSSAGLITGWPSARFQRPSI